MPLTYQGPISQKPARSLLSALETGEGLLSYVKDAYLDVRFAFGDFETLESMHSWFGRAAQTWIDIAAYPTETYFDYASELLNTTNSFRLSCIGRLGGTVLEISVENEQTDLRRFDDRLCYEHTDNESCVFRIQLVSEPTDLEKRDPRLWSIFERFHQHLAASFPTLEKPEEMDTDIEPVDSQDQGWLPRQTTIYRERNDLHYQLKRTQKHPLSLQIRCHTSAFAALTSAWSACINQLTRIDICQLRLSSPVSELASCLEKLDLHHDHRWGEGHRFGLTLRNRDRDTAMPDTVRTAWSESKLSNATEWDLRWHGHWGAQPESSDRNSCSPNRYVIRSSKGSTLDLLFIELPINDPDSQAFRSARQELSAVFHQRLSEKKAWQFEGSVLSSQKGTANKSLNAALDALVTALEPKPSDAIPQPLKPPGIISGLTRFFRRKGFDDLSFADLLSDAISEKLPGFRYDDSAHVSDDYFLEFYRKQPRGYELLQVQRLRNPSRFKFVLGVSEFKVYLDELQPTRYRAAPGIAVAFKRLLPEQWSDEYVMYSKRDLQTVIEIASAHLRHYGEPFFETTRPLLAEHMEKMNGKD